MSLDIFAVVSIKESVNNKVLICRLVEGGRTLCSSESTGVVRYIDDIKGVVGTMVARLSLGEVMLDVSISDGYSGVDCSDPTRDVTSTGILGLVYMDWLKLGEE